MWIVSFRFRSIAEVTATFGMNFGISNCARRIMFHDSAEPLGSLTTPS